MARLSERSYASVNLVTMLALEAVGVNVDPLAATISHDPWNEAPACHYSSIHRDEVVITVHFTGPFTRQHQVALVVNVRCLHLKKPQARRQEHFMGSVSVKLSVWVHIYTQAPKCGKACSQQTCVPSIRRFGASCKNCIVPDA